MEARADFLHRLRARVPDLHLAPRQATSWRRLVVIGVPAGLLGGLVMWAPALFYDWARDDHSALELPMAVTGWLFGLEHFVQNEYRWWPIVIGALFLLAYWALHGVAFAALADRVYHVRTLSGSMALGAAWGFVSFMFFWYMLLPIARDGAPFRDLGAGGFVAPNWIWILGFAVSGLATSLCYRALRRSEAAQPANAGVARREQEAA